MGHTVGCQIAFKGNLREPLERPNGEGLHFRTRASGQHLGIMNPPLVCGRMQRVVPSTVMCVFVMVSEEGLKVIVSLV